MYHIILFSVFSIWLQMICVNGSATYSVQLKYFKNPGGKDWNNDDCDKWWAGGCDTEFVICIDKPNRDNNDYNSCSYYRARTGEYGKNEITFATGTDAIDLQGGKKMDNPYTKTLSSWPGSINYTVKAIDDDVNSDDPIDRFKIDLDYEPSRSKTTATTREFRLRGSRFINPATLDIIFKVWCNDDYYGSKCDVLCHARDDDTGHWTCDPDDGSIVCRPGWKGESCTYVTCDQYDCHNGASCVETTTGFDCLCPAGYQGDKCEYETQECDSDPCMNGGECLEQVNQYHCDCPQLYVGTHCEYHVCDHPDQVHCLNGGTCRSDGSCSCPAGYKGIYCQINECDENLCYNDGTCVQGVCHCVKGYEGAQCKVDICSHKRCYNGGTCLAGECICPDGFTGDDCLTNINECISDPCLNDGTCRDQINSYICECLPDFNGTHCELHWTTTTPTAAPTTSGTEMQTSSTIRMETTSSQFIPPVIMSQTGEDDDFVPVYVAIPFVIIFILIIVLVVFCRRKRKKASESTNLQPTTNTMDSMNNFDNPLYTERGATGFQNNPDQDNIDNMLAAKGGKGHMPEEPGPSLSMSPSSGSVGYYVGIPPPAYDQPGFELPPSYEASTVEPGGAPVYAEYDEGAHALPTNGKGQYKENIASPLPDKFDENPYATSLDAVPKKSVPNEYEVPKGNVNMGFRGESSSDQHVYSNSAAAVLSTYDSPAARGNHTYDSPPHRAPRGIDENPYEELDDVEKAPSNSKA